MCIRKRILQAALLGLTLLCVSGSSVAVRYTTRTEVEAAKSSSALWQRQEVPPSAEKRGERNPPAAATDDSSAQESSPSERVLKDRYRERLRQGPSFVKKPVTTDIPAKP